MPSQMNTEQRQQVVANLCAIHRTLDVLIAVGELESAGNIATTLSGIWSSYRYSEDGAHYLSAILNAPGVDGLPDKLLAVLYDNCGELAERQAHYEQAEAHYKAALAQRIEDPRTIVQLLCKVAVASYQRGQYETAIEYCDRALEVARQFDMPDAMADVHQLLADVAWERGDQAESLERWAYAHTLAEEQGLRYALAHSFNMKGEVERAQHNYRTAIDHYQASAALFKAENPAELMMVKGNLAFALLGVGDVTKAEALFTLVYRYWEPRHAPFRSALYLTGLAGVQLATRSYQQAARSLSLANRHFAHSDGSLAVADRLEYQRIAASLRAHLSRDELRSIQECVASEERDAYAKGFVRPAETTVVFGEASAVSSRELEILRLVARGLTDRQIAMHCRISPHTVNSHMRAVYRKLQVNSRSAALHIAHRQGWL